MHQIRQKRRSEKRAALLRFFLQTPYRNRKSVRRSFVTLWAEGEPLREAFPIEKTASGGLRHQPQICACVRRVGGLWQRKAAVSHKEQRLRESQYTSSPSSASHAESATNEPAAADFVGRVVLTPLQHSSSLFTIVASGIGAMDTVR